MPNIRPTDVFPSIESISDTFFIFAPYFYGEYCVNFSPETVIQATMRTILDELATFGGNRSHHNHDTHFAGFSLRSATQNVKFSAK